ncbi:MAG: septum site-determining protein Ssd [Marmoricola sp.]
MTLSTDDPPAPDQRDAEVAAPLLVTSDATLAEEVRRLGAAAGSTPRVVADPVAALRRWAGAAVVLVGVDLAAALARHGPVRRADVHVIGAAPVPDEAFRDAVRLGAETVAELPASSDWLVELLTDAGEQPAEPAVTLGVMGGSGGAGATVLACALAHRAARRRPTLLVDADVLGAGVERVLGAEDRPGVRWDALTAATGRLSARSLREALPRVEDLHVLAFGRERPEELPPFAVREVLSAARRAFGCVVVDLPRHRSPVIEETLTRCDRVVLVSTLTVPGVAATARVAARLPAGVPVALVTRGGAAGVSPAEVSRLVGVPLLHAMGDQRHLDEGINLGAGPLRARRGVLGRAARVCVEDLWARPA